MSRVVSSLLILISLLFACAAFAQDDISSVSATCNYNDNDQLVAEYQHVAFNLKKPLAQQVPFGKVWVPGGKPVTLFTNTQIQVGPRVLPVGAYTLFVIPTAKQWTLVVSKSTDTKGSYTEQQDLVRVPMETGELPSPASDFSVSFAHAAPDQCNIRFDADKYGHIVVFQKR